MKICWKEPNINCNTKKDPVSLMTVMAELSRFLNGWLLYYFKVTLKLLVKVTEEISLSVFLVFFFLTIRPLSLCSKIIGIDIYFLDFNSFQLDHPGRFILLFLWICCVSVVFTILSCVHFLSWGFLDVRVCTKLYLWGGGRLPFSFVLYAYSLCSSPTLFTTEDHR